MKNTILFLIFSFIFFACKNEIKKQSQENGEEVVKEDTRIEYPSISKEEIQKMHKEVDYVDYIWHNTGFSISLEEKEAIQSNVLLISEKPVGKIPFNCKPDGNKAFNIKGNTFLSADVYFSPGCTFYVFLKDNKPVSANQMTEQGVNFYTNVFKQGANKAGQ